MYNVSIKYCVFFQEFSIFCDLSSHWAAIGCTENDQQIIVAVHIKR